MQTRTHLANAWHIIRGNSLRSFLTMLGIIIGVFSVMVIMSVGAGAQSLILNQITSLGSNLIGVLPGKSDEQGPPASVFGIVITTLKQEDAKAILAYGSPHIQAVAVYVRGIDTVTTDTNETDTNFVGTTASYPAVENVSLLRGRFFSEDEEKGIARVAVLGSSVAQELFEDQDPIGQEIQIKRSRFSVVGVIASRGVSGFQNQDNQIFVPVITAQKLLLGIRHISFMRIKIDDASAVPESIEIIKQVLREQHGVNHPDQDDFSVRSMNQGLEAITNITDAIRFFLAAIAAISLLVGGIGIMNIMLAAVEERTKEIGLRKAVGATNHHITLQFLIETVCITVTGGIIGILLGSSVSYLVGIIAQGLGYRWDIHISLPSIALGVGISILVGLLFGITPAKKASHLNPITALRYE